MKILVIFAIMAGLVLFCGCISQQAESGAQQAGGGDIEIPQQQAPVADNAAEMPVAADNLADDASEQQMPVAAGNASGQAQIRPEINPQDYALTPEDMPGFEQTYFAMRNATELNSTALKLGWKTGFSAAYANSTHKFAQFISIYPKENISRVISETGFGEDETKIEAKSFGEGSEAIAFVDEEGQPGMNIAFYRGEVLETLYVSGDDVSILEWYAKKAEEKAG